MSAYTNHEKSKDVIIKELESVLKAAMASPHMEKGYIPSEITQNICNVIEAIFIHGLRDPFFVKGSRYAKYPEPNFWPFVSKYSHKSITTEINSLKQVRSEIGRGRAWIRIVVNQKSLEHYVRLLLGEAKAVNQFYDEDALLRDEEEMTKISGLLKGLDRLPIRAAVNSSFLNTWTPSPLILAGLVNGKPLKVGELAPRYRTSSLRDNSAEVGMSAIDFLQSDQSPLLMSPILGKEKPGRRAVLSDDDESVYSHPSLIDHSERVPERVILSSSPSTNNAYAYEELPPQSVAPLIVSRRTRRRKSSRSSSESNSKGSRSLSECTSTAATGLNETEASFASSNHTRTRPETLDSGIDSENRDPNLENVSSVSDEKCTEIIEVDQKQVVEVGPSLVSEELSTMDPPTADDAYDMRSSSGNKDERVEVQSSRNDNVFEDNVPDCEEVVAVPVTLLPPEQKEVIPNVSSLHEELLFAEMKPGSNSLLSRGWKKASTVSEPGRVGSAVLSSPSENEAEGGNVSFDQALRTAMESGAPPHKEGDLDDTRELGFETDVEDDDDEQNLESRKTSVNASEHVVAMLTTIPREVGLDSQDFRCPMCRKSIGAPFSKYGVCGIDGMYYCADCMRAGGEMPIPSRVLRSWDWKPREVSDRGRAFIEANQDNVIIRIDQHNPTLYDHVHVLKAMKCMREKLQIASMYLFNCRESIAEDFRRRVWPRNHLYTDIHAYSISDLHHLHSGLLERHIRGFLKHAVDHVMHCSLCRQKGFICEICDVHDVIYPFQTDTTYRCPHCFSVYHADCGRRFDDCPKCVRRAKYEIRQEAGDLPLG